ncbi:MAG: hypothetical protein R3C61_16815 [Bacteroidia bacterium]
MKYIYLFLICLLLGFASYKFYICPRELSSLSNKEITATDSLRTMMPYSSAQKPEDQEETYEYESTDLSGVVLYAVIHFFLDLYQ